MVKTTEKEEIIHWVSESAIPSYITLGFEYGNELRMGYALPKWIQGVTEPCILLLDDYTRASTPVLQATNEIIDRQEHLAWKLPLGSTVILTANPSGQDYMVASLDSAMETRKLTFNMRFDVDSWAAWAEANKIDSRAINFILKFPEVVQGVGVSTDSENNKLQKGNIRIWTKYFEALSGIEDFEDSLERVINLGVGSLPEEHITTFAQFVKQGLDKIMSPYEMLTSKPEKVLQHFKEVITPGGKTRQDISAIVTKRLLTYAMINTADYTSEMVSNYGKLLESEYLSQDLLLITARKLAQYQKFEKLVAAPKMIALLTK